eukprot:7733598-Pyramimonas_sp.AAC.1
MMFAQLQRNCPVPTRSLLFPALLQSGGGRVYCRQLDREHVTPTLFKLRRRSRGKEMHQGLRFLQWSPEIGWGAEMCVLADA